MKRYSRRLRFNRKFGSRVRRSRLIFKSRFRRVSRMMRRNRARPELKFIMAAGNQAVAVNSRYTAPVSPFNMDTGTGEGQRVGNSIKSLRLQIRVEFSSSVTTSTIAAYSATTFRVIFWTPRIDYDQSQTTMDLLDYLEPVDYNVATVHSDKYVTIGVDAFTAGYNPTQVIAGASMPPVRQYTFYFKFPRKMEWRGGSNTMNPNKDVMYCTIINNDLQVSINFDWGSRLTYIDP